MTNIILVLQLITFISNLVLGLFVFRANPRSRINFLYAVFAIALAFWNISLFFTILAVWPQIIWSRLALSFGVIMATALFSFSLVFPGSFRVRRWIDLVLTIFAVILTGLTLTKWTVSRVEVVDGYITGDFGLVIIPFSIYLLLGFFGSIFVLFHKYNQLSGLARQQLFYVLTGVGFFTLAFLATNLILPVFFGIFKYNNFGPIFSLPMIMLIGYAIVKHRLMDIRVVIQRSVLYLVTLAIVTAIYFIGIFTLESIFTKNTDASSFVSAIVAAILAIIGYPYFKNYFQKVTDNFFFKGQYDSYKTLKSLGRSLSGTLDLRELLNSTEKIIARNLKIDKFLFFLQDSSGVFRIAKNTNFKIKDEKKLRSLADTFLQNSREIVVFQEIDYQIKKMSGDDKEIKLLKKIKFLSEKFEVALVVPVFSKNNLNGILILGKKLSGDAFMKKDIEMLNIFSQQAGTAFENAKLYEEVKEYSENLEKKVKERTRKLKQLHNYQLKFLTDLSHELQTPMSVLKGNLGLLHEKIGSNKTNNKILEAMDRSSDRVSKIINDLLFLVREDFKNKKFVKKPVNLTKLLQEIYEDFQILAWNRNIYFYFQKYGEMIALGDEEKLRELFINLISNALKYTSVGGKIEIRLSEKNNYAEVVVSDTGCGILQKDLPHIFERFYQVSKGQSKSEGVGLGLAICKQIIESHDGKINVKTKMGEGSEFIVLLPIYKK